MSKLEMTDTQIRVLEELADLFPEQLTIEYPDPDLSDVEQMRLNFINAATEQGVSLRRRALPDNGYNEAFVNSLRALMPKGINNAK